jgi:hypothetical protein
VQRNFEHIYNRKKLLRISHQHPRIPSVQCQKKLHIGKRLHQPHEEDTTTTTTEVVVMTVVEEDTPEEEETLEDMGPGDKHTKDMVEDTEGGEANKEVDIRNLRWECKPQLIWA